MGSCSSRVKTQRLRKDLIDLGELSFLVHGRPKKSHSTHATQFFVNREIVNLEKEFELSELDDFCQEIN